jgi:uncharacterized protein involved in outer membrane biogenesis
MKKLFKIAVIVVGVLVLLGVGLSLFVKSYLSSDKLKSILLPKAETAIGRKVLLDEINVSLFKGIVAKGLSVKERDGQKDFLKAGRFILSYRLLPLLKKQLVISKIEIASPSIAIKRDREGKYNFSDITEKPSKEPPKPSRPEPQKFPVSIVTDRVFIRDAHLTFVDEGKALPDISVFLNGEFKGGLGKDRTPRMEFGRITLKEIKASLKEMEVKISGKIDMDEKTVRATLQAWIGKDGLDLSATVKDYSSAPDVTADLHAKSLDLQKFLALSGGKKAPEEGPPKKDKKAELSEGGLTKKLKAQGQITIDEAKYQEYTIKDLRMNYRYVKGAMKVEPLGFQFASGGSFTADGSINGDLQFAGEEASAIQKTMKGKAVAKLGKGAIKQSQIFDAIALLTGISALKHPGFDQGLFNFDVKEEKIYLDGWITSSLFKVSSKGWVDFEKRLEIPTELKISPNLTGRLTKGFASIKFLEDEQGWTIIPLKIKGTTEKPSVSLDEGALSRQLGPILKKGIEKFLSEKTSGESGKPSKKKKEKDLLKELFGK